MQSRWDTNSDYESIALSWIHCKSHLAKDIREVALSICCIRRELLSYDLHGLITFLHNIHTIHW